MTPSTRRCGRSPLPSCRPRCSTAAAGSRGRRPPRRTLSLSSSTAATSSASPPPAPVKQKLFGFCFLLGYPFVVPTCSNFKFLMNLLLCVMPGKTIAFGVPALMHIRKKVGGKAGKKKVPRCLVLSPTRELAQQVNQQLAIVVHNILSLIILANNLCVAIRNKHVFYT